MFVGVPVVRTLEGEARARSMRMLGQRWRPIGYGSLIALGISGLVLADEHFALDWDVLGETTFGRVLLVKSVLVLALVATAIAHDYVLGPRLQQEIREGRPPATRRRLVAVGWASFALTITIPILGVWMTTEAHP